MTDNRFVIADILLYVTGPRDTTVDASLLFQVVDKTLGEMGGIDHLNKESKNQFANRLAVNSVSFGLCRPNDNIEEPLRKELDALFAYQYPISAALFASEWHFIHTLLRQRLLEVDAGLVGADTPEKKIALLDERACLVDLKERLGEQVN